MTDDTKREKHSNGQPTTSLESSDSDVGATVKHVDVCFSKNATFTESYPQTDKPTKGCTNTHTECPVSTPDIGQTTASTDGPEPKTEATPSQRTETFPEGGLQAWLVVLGAWLALFSSLGILNSLATFQTYVSTHQLANESQDTIGWIFSLNAFVCFFAGVYIGPIFDKYGPRWLVLAGTLCLVTSLVLLSFCTSEN